MIKSIILAVARNGVIGNAGTLPWHLPADMKYFRQITTGHCCIMGRKTFDSMGMRALPNRTNIVVSRTVKEISHDRSILLFENLDNAITYCEAKGETECFVIGGASLAQEFMPRADKLYITRIDEAFEGDTRVEFDLLEWSKTQEDAHEPDAKNKYKYSFEIWTRNLLNDITTFFPETIHFPDGLGRPF